METMEELSLGSNDLSMIMKGKRTKRWQSPLSPPISDQPVVAGTSSSSSGGGGSGEDGDVLGYFYHPLNPPSTNTTTTSTSDDQEEEDDDQDQDIANCLILLAQGDNYQSIRKKDNFNYHHHHQEDVSVAVDEIKVEKFISRRFTEMVTSTTGSKVGFFVYECKTCNRTFPSFQALGGHRASHKKPKVVTEEKPKAAINEHRHQEEEAAVDHQEIVVIKQEGVQAQEVSISKCKAKNHECSICGAEFSSGQALGGHMRRHRNPPPSAMASSATKVSMVRSIQEDVDEESHVVKKKQKIHNNVFQLDLNLPAPVEEDHHHHHHHIHKDLKFQQQQHLVFSATPALVDCHY